MPAHNRAKSKSHKSHKSHGLHRNNDERVRAYQNNNNNNKKQSHSNNKGIVNDEFDRELFNLKERQSGAYGRNKAKKTLVASNIVIQAPILPMNITTIDKPKSIIEELIMNEESDNREHTTINRNHDMTDRSRHANIFAVLDDDDEKLKINIQPSILQFNIKKHEEHEEHEEIDPDI